MNLLALKKRQDLLSEALDMANHCQQQSLKYIEKVEQHLTLIENMLEEMRGEIEEIESPRNKIPM